MKFTKEDLAKAIKLRVGDKIKILKTPILEKFIFELNEHYYLLSLDGTYRIELNDLIDEEYQIVPPKKLIGNLVIENINRNFIVENSLGFLRELAIKENIDKSTFYNALGVYKAKYSEDDIYKKLKSKLDKEINTRS